MAWCLIIKAQGQLCRYLLLNVVYIVVGVIFLSSIGELHIAEVLVADLGLVVNFVEALRGSPRFLQANSTLQQTINIDRNCFLLIHTSQFILRCHIMYHGQLRNCRYIQTIGTYLKCFIRISFGLNRLNMARVIAVLKQVLL
jgi:hypothetical protein